MRRFWNILSRITVGALASMGLLCVLVASTWFVAQYNLANFLAGLCAIFIGLITFYFIGVALIGIGNNDD